MDACHFDFFMCPKGMNLYPIGHGYVFSGFHEKYQSRHDDEAEQDRYGQCQAGKCAVALAADGIDRCDGRDRCESDDSQYSLSISPVSRNVS